MRELPCSFMLRRRLSTSRSVGQFALHVHAWEKGDVNFLMGGELVLSLTPTDAGHTRGDRSGLRAAGRPTHGPNSP